MREEQTSRPIGFLAVLGTLALTTLATALGDKTQPMFNHTVLLAGLAAGYAVAHYVTAEWWTRVFAWACMNAKMHALSFWRWVGWTCPQQLQSWYCLDVWTNRTLVVYADSTNAWWTAVTWAVLTAVYTATSSEDFKNRWFFRTFDACFWFMFFVAPHLPRLYVEGDEGLVVVVVVAAVIIFGALLMRLWSSMQWAWVALSVIVFAARLGSGEHIHHIEWPWWLIPLTIGTPQGGALAGMLMGISAQEFTGAGIAKGKHI